MNWPLRIDDGEQSRNDSQLIAANLARLHLFLSRHDVIAPFVFLLDHRDR